MLCLVVRPDDPGASDDKNLPSCSVEAKTGGKPGKQHSTSDTNEASFVYRGMGI